MTVSFWHNKKMAKPGEQPTAECDAERPHTVPDPTPGVVRGLGQAASVKEVGGPGGPEPTRFGDWERSGRCIDF